jgi:D-inositol-3-phosphate glycosyltransferase
MAAGLPVVASDVGDVGRAVDNGETGFLVPPRDPEVLAQALEKLLTDPALRRRMGDAGEARVGEHFSAEATVRSISEMYEELLKASR